MPNTEPAFRWEINATTQEEVGIYREGPNHILLGVGPSLHEKQPLKTIALDRASARLLAHALLLHSETLSR